MAVSTITRNDVAAVIDKLPADKWQDLLEFVEFLQFKSGIQSDTITQLGKEWQDLPIAVADNNSQASPLRPFGLCVGEFTVPDDFDAPLPDDILDLFESK